MRAAGETIQADADGVVAFDIDVATEIANKLKLSDIFRLLHDAQVLANELELNGNDMGHAEETMILEYALDHDRFIAAGMLIRQTQSESIKRRQKKSDEGEYAHSDGTVEPEQELETPEPKETKPTPAATTGRIMESAFARKERERRERQEIEIARAARKLAEQKPLDIEYNSGNWERGAKCADHDPEVFFPVKDLETELFAKSVCARCDVSAFCLTVALEDRYDFGIWGGLTEKERARLRLRRALGKSY